MSTSFIHDSKAIGGFRFREPYPPSFGELAGSPHLGTDWQSNYDKLYAPCDGRIIDTPYGEQGGQWLYLEETNTKACKYYGADRLIHRFAHLSVVYDSLNVKKNDIIAVSGNSGNATTGPHTHHDISKNDVNIYDIDNFIDPEEYFNLDIMELTEWEQNAIKWAKKEGIIENPESAPFDLKQVAWLAEVLRKSKKKV